MQKIEIELYDKAFIALEVFCAAIGISVSKFLKQIIQKELTFINDNMDCNLSSLEEYYKKELGKNISAKFIEVFS